MYLSLPLPSGKGISKVSIGQCIENFVRPETLEGDDAWWVEEVLNGQNTIELRC